MSIYSRQPYKAIWTAITVISLFIRIPFIALYFIPTASRPHREWTYRQAIGRQLLRMFLVYASTVELKFPLSLDPGSEKERFVMISPAAPEFYQQIPGDSKPAIQPTVIGATWFPKLYNPTNDNGKNIILHFHGGGYVLGGSRDTACNFSANNLIKATSAMVLFLQYRLASSPGGEFPAAFQDAVTSYTYLLHDLGIAPSRITISGDSVGAHLAVTLLRYISQNGSLLPAPRAASALESLVRPEHRPRQRHRPASQPKDRLHPFALSGVGGQGFCARGHVANGSVHLAPSSSLPLQDAGLDPGGWGGGAARSRHGVRTGYGWCGE